MKVYIAHPVSKKANVYSPLDDLISWLQRNQFATIQPTYFLFSEILSNKTIKSLNTSKVLIADVSERSHGVGFEIGYAFSKKKTIILIARESLKDDISPFVLSLFKDIIFYVSSDDLIDKIAKRLALLNLM